MVNKFSGENEFTCIAKFCCTPLSGERLKYYVSRPLLEKSLLRAMEEAQRRNTIVIVHGAYGSGKTTLVNKVLADLENSVGNSSMEYRVVTAMVKVRPEEEDFERKRSFITFEKALRWLILNIYEELGIKKDVSEIKHSLLKQFIEMVDVFPGVLPGKLEELYDKVKGFEEFSEEMYLGLRGNWSNLKKALMSPKLPPTYARVILRDFRKTLEKLLGKRDLDWVVVVVDDLSQVDAIDRRTLLKIMRKIAGDISGLTFIAIYSYPDLVEKSDNFPIFVQETCGDALLIEVPPVSQEDLDTLEKIARSMGFEVDRSALRMLWEKTRGILGRMSIVLNTVYAERGVNRIGLNELKAIPYALDEQIKAYIKTVHRDVEEVLYVASCLLSFTKSEFKEIFKEWKGGRVAEYLRELEKRGLIEKLGVHKGEEVYAFDHDALWLRDAIYNIVLGDDYKIGIHKAAVAHYEKQPVEPKEWLLTMPKRRGMAIIYHSGTLVKLLNKGARREENYENRLKALCATSFADDAYFCFMVLNNTKLAKEYVNVAEEILSDVNTYSSKLEWLNAYLIVLQVKALISMYERKYSEAEEILYEFKSLLEKYEKEIVNTYGPEGYYRRLAIVENILGELHFRKAELSEAKKHLSSALEFFLRGRDNRGAAGVRLNIALIDFILAENTKRCLSIVHEKIGGFDLNKCIEVFRKANDPYSEAMVRELLALIYIAGGDYLRALDEARTALKSTVGIVEFYEKVGHMLTLAYVFTLLGLIFDDNSMVEWCSDLVAKAHSFSIKSKDLSNIILNTIASMQLCLLGLIPLEDFIENLEMHIELLEEKKDFIGVCVLEGFLDAVRKRGLSEEIIGFEGAKLLAAL